ncbi:MAG: hypothetical protein IJO92_01750 [Clostridia bacterium]|nr:hypothetical protein [Clostridia bacterium]
MNKRVWSIAVALVMLLSMVCSVFVVSAADESVPEGDASDATVQLNNNASEQPALLNTESATYLEMSSSADHYSVDDEFAVSASLKNYNGDWAIFSAALTFDPQELEYQGFTSKLGDAFTLTVDDSDKATGRLTVWMMSNEGANLPADENSSAALMDLQFKAIGETDSADLTFTFADESVAGYVDGDPQFIDSGAYTATSVFESVAIRVYRPYLTMRLVDESGNAVTEITQGQTVKAIVSLKQYYPDESWAMMSLDLQFNGNKFKYDLNSLISKENLVDSVTGEAVTMLPAETEDPAKPLSICFFSSELNDMVLNGGATEADILELTLEATGAGNALEIGASFLQEGNIKYNTETGEEEVLIPAEDYIEEHEEGTAVIKVTQTKFPYLSVSVDPDKTTFAPGESFTLKVNINDYVDPFSMMSILVDLGADAYEVDTDNIVAFGGSGVAVAEKIGNKLGITIFSEDGDDLKLSGGLTSGTVLEIPIKAISNAGNGTPIQVSFLEGGNFSGDEEAGYDKTVPPVELNITVQGKPELSIRIDQIDGVDVPDGEESISVEQGKEVTFVVSVKDFAGAWDVMTLKALFDSDVFELVEVNGEPATDLEPFVVPEEDGAFSEFIPEAGNGALLACWFNSGPLSMTNPDRDVMQFTLKVKHGDLTQDQLSQLVSVEFLEDGNYANDNMLTGEDYTETPAEVEFTITKVDLEVSVEISWGAMQFTYNFGTWDPNDHVWDGRGWTCLNAEDEDENYITVTNQGGVDITANFEFSVDEANTDLAGLTHSFKQGEDTVTSLDVAMADGETYPSETVYFELAGDLPEGALSEDAENPTQLGTIKVTIDMADS